MGIFGAILKGVGLGAGAAVVGGLILDYCDKRAERKAEEARIAEEKAEQARRAAQIRWEKEKVEREKEERRRNTPCYFAGKLSQNDFCTIIKRVHKRMSKRLRIDYVESTVVAATFYSQSGLSNWSFKIDFNDFGDVTGEYWWLSKCYCESNIPEFFADQIKNEIELHRSRN